MQLEFEWLNKDNQKIFEKLKQIIFAKDSMKDEMIDIYERVNNGETKEYDPINYALIKADNKVVGITGYYSKANDKDNIWLGWFGVLPEYRKRGYGKESLIKMENHIRENFPERRAFRLYTGPKDNKDAVRLYKKLGFIEQPELFNFDTIIMGKMLNNDPYEKYEGEPVW